MDAMRVKSISDAAMKLKTDALDVGYDEAGAQLCVDNLVACLNRGMPEGLFFQKHNDGEAEDLVLMTTEMFDENEQERAMNGIVKAWKSVDQNDIWA